MMRRAAAILALFVTGLAVAQEKQAPRPIRPGFAACYDAAAWVTLARLEDARDVAGFNERFAGFRNAGVCRLTRPGEMVWLQASEVAGSVRISRAGIKEPAPAYVRTQALAEP